MSNCPGCPFDCPFDCPPEPMPDDPELDRALEDSERTPLGPDYAYQFPGPD
jgi:hypothetical protein